MRKEIDWKEETRALAKQWATMGRREKKRYRARARELRARKRDDDDSEMRKATYQKRSDADESLKNLNASS